MKILQKNTSSRHSWTIRALTASVVIGMTATVVQAADPNRKPIGDLEIYAPAKPGTATIFMMLDISGSMDERSIADDYSRCEDSYRSQNSEEITAVIRGRDDDGKINNSIEESISFTPKGCHTSRNWWGDFSDMHFDRLTRLQKALIELLADEVYKGDKIKASNRVADKDKGTLPDDYEIGVGAFSHDSDGDSAYVIVPTRALTADQRIELIKEVKKLKANGGTPTAPALAESGAYMMGTTTISDVKVVAEREYYRGDAFWRRCYGNDSSLLFDDELGISVYKCNNWGSWSRYSSILPDYNVDSNIDHADGGRTYFAGDNSNSGFAASVITSKQINTDKNAYISPLNDNECSGNGIYLLTDGVPSRNIYDSEARAIMNKSLEGSNLSIESCDNSNSTGLDGRDGQAWGCMANYSKLLRNPENPGKLPIKTATVGFGKTFAGLTGTREITTNGKQVKVTDCDSGSASQDARNLCRLGERRGDDEVKTFGDGGFYYTEESKDIAASVTDFAANLVQIINTAPSGTITIPDDPYRASNQLAYAYLPMLDPDIASTASIWKGNLKKYNLDQGTLFGKSKSLLYKDVAGDLSATTQDLWQSGDFIKGGKRSNNDVEAGGVYAQLKSPSSGLSSLRTIYVEDYTSSGNKKPTLRKVWVDTNGKPQGFEQLVDTNTYTQLNKRRLLSFLGFRDVLTDDGQPVDNKKVEDLKLKAPDNEIKVLGGVVHSKPAAISYSAKLDENGRITDTRDDYVLFGSMDGALHLVDADKGEETYAIIPKLMLETQPEALVDDSIKAEIGTPYFGIDAPWLVTTDYDYDLDNKRVKVDTSASRGMFAYGGLRMGGEAFYGIDISNKSNPKVKFSITPNSLNGDSSTSFSRLGQIWSKPTAAKIRLKKDDDPTNVLIFGGGYDMAYEDDEYMASNKAPAKGNAVYMIDASDGKLLWSTSGESGGNKNVKTSDMIHSITGEVTVLDRDNDGLMDHFYVADLGGQVFRADFENARPAKFGFDAVSNFSNKGVTRILNSKPSGQPAYRFYERPVVSFYRNQSTSSNNGKLFALINVISGNRSAPLSTLRKNNTYANRVYGIIDYDITNAYLYETGFKPTAKDLTESKLTNLASALGSKPTETVKNNAKSAMIMGTKQGWYYPLTRFDGYNNVRYNKGVGDSAVINNLLYTTVYNPDKLYGTVSSCSAKISGGSERQLYCLPYGVCMESTSESGTGGYLPAGQGIQELTLGAYNADNTDLKVLIGNTTITERALQTNRTGYGKDTIKDSSNIKDLYPGENSAPTQVGGDGTLAEYIFNERYTMQPRVWYERQK